LKVYRTKFCGVIATVEVPIRVYEHGYPVGKPGAPVYKLQVIG
jgi:hypothetical protein